MQDKVVLWLSFISNLFFCPYLAFAQELRKRAVSDSVNRAFSSAVDRFSTAGLLSSTLAASSLKHDKTSDFLLKSELSLAHCSAFSSSTLAYEAVFAASSSAHFVLRLAGSWWSPSRAATASDTAWKRQLPSPFTFTGSMPEGASSGRRPRATRSCSKCRVPWPGSLDILYYSTSTARNS